MKQSNYLSKAGLDNQWVDAFITPTLKTLAVQAQCDCSVKDFLTNDQSITISKYTRGSVKLESEKFSGEVSLYLPDNTFLKIYNAMFGEEAKIVEEEMTELAGEMINMIYGQAKHDLNEKYNCTLEPKLPEIHRTKDVKLTLSDQSQINVIIPFYLKEEENFYIEIILNNNWGG